MPLLCNFITEYIAIQLKSIELIAVKQNSLIDQIIINPHIFYGGCLEVVCRSTIVRMGLNVTC
jgi:hypothetical protein